MLVLVLAVPYYSMKYQTEGASCESVLLRTLPVLLNSYSNSLPQRR